MRILKCAAYIASTHLVSGVGELQALLHFSRLFSRRGSQRITLTKPEQIASQVKLSLKNSPYHQQ
jgi:hypothetical protein